RSLPVVVPVAVLSVFLVRNFDTPAFPSYEVPEGFTPAPPPETVPPVGARPVLAAVGGTTTTAVPPNVGSSRVHGRVMGPDGPVPGATVRIERYLVDDQRQSVDVPTDPDGAFDLPGVGGGRYRVRAFLPPTLGQAEAEVFFLPDGEDRSLVLVLDRFGETEVTIAVAPNPPLLDQALNVAVAVRARLVDADGFVTVQPVVGALVDIVATGPWQPVTPDLPQLTAGDGFVQATYLCRLAAPATVQATVLVGPDQPTAFERVDVPACVAPAPPPTAPTSSSSTSSTPSTPTTEDD
ncbi:MAG: carboxypeptidase-like regulatory domain-containing protein, partial [Acidimicrobiales bacterium]